MFASLKTIDSAFQQVKTLALLFIVAVLVLAGTIAYFAFQSTNAAANRIYVLEGGQLTYYPDLDEAIAVHTRNMAV